MLFVYGRFAGGVRRSVAVVNVMSDGAAEMKFPARWHADRPGNSGRAQ
jgi:hypothetical protein